MMIGDSIRRKAYCAELRRNPRREQSASVLRSGRDRFCMLRRNARWRYAMALAVTLTNQLQKVMIVHVFDLIGENYKPPIDFVQLAPLEVISELLAAQAQRMPP